MQSHQNQVITLSVLDSLILFHGQWFLLPRPPALTQSCSTCSVSQMLSLSLFLFFLGPSLWSIYFSASSLCRSPQFLLADQLSLLPWFYRRGSHLFQSKSPVLSAEALERESDWLSLNLGATSSPINCDHSGGGVGHKGQSCYTVLVAGQFSEKGNLGESW